MHEAYCFRNVSKCLKCDEFVDKNMIEEHEEENHKLLECEYCGK